MKRNDKQCHGKSQKELTQMPVKLALLVKVLFLSVKAVERNS